MKTGPIILIEDDTEDAEIFKEILKELNVHNELIWFSDSLLAFDYLKETLQAPFIIFSDVNIPKCNGIELKSQIDDDWALRKKSIPFVFYSTSVDQQVINKAYTQMTVQGFFKKAISYNEMKSMLEKIFAYWNLCQHPNSVV